MSILDYVPAGYTLRPGQRKLLLELEANYHRYDVAVIEGPVGFGKSLVARVFAKWLEVAEMGTNIVTPKVVLQQQYTSEFKELPSLKGRGRYECQSRGYKTCQDYYDVNETHCAQCPFTKARAACKSQLTAILNIHSYLFAGDDIYKPGLVIDEAHNLVETLSDMYAISLWQDKESWPDNLGTHGDLAIWLEDRCKQLEKSLAGKTKPQQQRVQTKIKQSRRVIDGLVKAPASFFIEQTKDWYRGKMVDLLRVRPTTAQHLPHGLWPRNRVRKILLMSATIHEMDVQRLGLSGKRVMYFRGESAIPAYRRPFVAEACANMSWKFQNANIGKVCRRIEELADKHKGEKGIIHTTYSLSGLMRQHLKGPRYLWHTQDQEDKDRVYKQFLEATDDVVLVACGMSEGIDLAGDFGRWQVITKVQYPSLQDPLNAKQLREEPDYYNWRTVRTIVQQYGRICRGPEDYGVTYMLDAGFKDFYRRTRKLWPDYLKIDWGY